MVPPDPHIFTITAGKNSGGPVGPSKFWKKKINDLFLCLYPKWHINSCSEVNFSEKKVILSHPIDRFYRKTFGEKQFVFLEFQAIWLLLHWNLFPIQASFLSYHIFL